MDGDENNDRDEEYLPTEDEEEEERNEEKEMEENQREEVIILRQPKKATKPPPKSTKPTNEKKTLGIIPILANEFIKTSSVVKANFKQPKISDKMLYSAFREKCAENRVNRVTVDKMISYLQIDQEKQANAYDYKKLRLNDDYIYNVAFTENQEKIIEDLKKIEVSQEIIDNHIAFANYYIKLCELILKYNRASTDKSKESVKSTIEALKRMPFGSDGYIPPMMWYETLFIQPRDSFCFTVGVVVLAFMTRTLIEMKWEAIPFLFSFWFQVITLMFDILYYFRVQFIELVAFVVYFVLFMIWNWWNAYNYVFWVMLSLVILVVSTLAYIRFEGVSLATWAI
jgi:hypothetical protein